MRRPLIKSQFAKMLTELKKHLKNCDKCKLVLKGNAFNLECNEGQILSFKVAMMSDRLATLHRKAYDNPHGFIYACPDRQKHGIDFALTAEPHPLIATQDTLF